jgi:hypothetical protein
MKISKQKFRELIKEEALKLFNEEKEITDAGDVLDVDMNSMDRVDNSDGSAYVKAKESGGFEKKKNSPKAAENIDEEEGVMDVKMNAQDKDQGHDEDIAAATKVSAKSSKKSGASIEGMHNSDFESKKDNPSVSSSEPFEDRIGTEPKMNSQDKEGDKGAKTYVEAGSDITGREPHTTGQKKAVASEKAKNEKETKERIAQGIQLPESFKNKKEMISFINEEADKISKLL